MKRTKERVARAVEMYESGMTLEAVAKFFPVHLYTISRWLGKANSARRWGGNTPKGSKCWHWKGGGSSYTARVARKAAERNNISLNICSKCKEEEDFESLHVHHIDGNRHNNDVKNLLVLCNSCHQSVHRSEESLYKRKRDSYGRWTK